jgi:hypothetical protein
VSAKEQSHYFHYSRLFGTRDTRGTALSLYFYMALTRMAAYRPDI